MLDPRIKKGEKMIFNVCLSVFLVISFLIVYAGLSAIIQKINFIVDSLKRISDILKVQSQVDIQVKSSIEDIFNNTVCIYQKLPNTDKPNGEAETKSKRRKTEK